MVRAIRRAEICVEELYRATEYVFYSQVSLIDAEDDDAWPEIVSDRPVYSGPKGIVVPAASDSDVERAVFRGDADPGGALLFDGEMCVGAEGLEVGSPPLDMRRIAWPPGRTQVRVYVDGPAEMPHRIMFVLRHLEDD
jgi:hypothetical protein